jgi:1-acyl-sn-glycerol-3-phosphate acyltransferase
MNEKSLIGFPEGTLKRMEMPRFMKGLIERQKRGET